MSDDKVVYLFPHTCHRDNNSITEGERQSAIILGTVIGGLVRIHSIDDVKSAIKFLAETDAMWEELRNSIK